MKPIAIGTDDFREIIESNSLFIDKTLFIKELIDDTSKVLLFPRPRRFGKSLNMSMLKYYFDINLNSKYLFKGLNISKCSKLYLDEMNKYPVVSLTLKECKKATYEEFLMSFKTLISNLYYNYQFLLDSPLIKEVDKEYFKRCVNEEEEKQLSLALAKLINMLEIYYKSQVIVLLDEYDAPILEGYLKGYYDNIINFMREVFSSTFKGNLSLKKGVITGILRVSKESMFSGANNINVYNITDSNFSTYFGFTEEEVKETLAEYGLSDKFLEVKKWYDGYLFSRTTIYNPWSILNFLANHEHILKVYWANTGGTDLLQDLIYSTKGNTNLLETFHTLLEKGSITGIDLDLEMNLPSLNNNSNTVWTLFMLSGYLTPKDLVGNPKNIALRIPNLEIRENLENICVNWFKDNIKYNSLFEKYLFNNDMESFKNTFNGIVLESFSYYDVGLDNGENFYHAFVMGLLYSGSNNFIIKSNRESGFGRYDLILKPRNEDIKYAYIIEFKAIENGNFEETVEKAFKQIEDKDYVAEVKDYDVTKIVIVFKGKECRIETRK